MPNVDYSVTLCRDIEDLIPTFLRNRRNELRALRLALKEDNFEYLLYLGNRMRGCGVPYGFDHVSTLGQFIAEAAQSKNSGMLDDTIREYATYLSCVQVSFAADRDPN